jgi:hypothetical protein
MSPIEKCWFLGAVTGTKLSVDGIWRDKELEALVVCHCASADQKLRASDLSDMCKQEPTPVHVMFQMRLLLCPADCTDELQELHIGRRLPLLAVQVI